MKIKCVRQQLTDEERQMLGADPRFRPTPGITVGKEYLVLGFVGVIGSPQYGNTALFEIINDDRQFVLHPAVLFEASDPRCSSYWRVTIFDDGSVALRPEEFEREFFHDHFSDGDPVAQQVFRAVVAKLEAEFPA